MTRLEDIAAKRYVAGPSRNLMVPTSELPEAQRTEADGMMGLIARLAPQARTIMGMAYDSSLIEVGRAMGLVGPDREPLWTFETGYKAGGWLVPDEWVLNDSYWGGSPLSVVSYSRSVDESGTADELKRKGVLHTHADRPYAAPYVYNFYDREGGPAGNCMSQSKIDAMPSVASNIAVMVDSTFRPGVLRLLRATAGAEDQNRPPVSRKTNIVFMAHLDHPGQANDGLSGVAVLVALHNWIRQQQEEYGRKFKYTYEFVIVPESIGSACYLSRRTPGYGNVLGAVVLDLVGGRGHLLLQHSLQHATDRPAPYIDRVMEYAAAMREPAFAVAPYRAVVRGDDANLNGPRYRIPTVVLARWPFAEYHTSD
ncbi:MAG: DUF4910 domain-containing protein, partial [Dehalococcoidia bacterium]|nr:DUF4910 domain-containing protein [Dehalococcoidia bacterium]